MVNLRRRHGPWSRPRIRFYPSVAAETSRSGAPPGVQSLAVFQNEGQRVARVQPVVRQKTCPFAHPVSRVTEEFVPALEANFRGLEMVHETISEPVHPGGVFPEQYRAL